MIDLLAELTTVAATSAFSTMADCALTAQPAAAVALNGERCITSSVRYSGPVSGVLHLHAPGGLARQISATLLSQARVDDVPVLDGLAITLLLAEMMVKMRRLGIFHSRHGRTNARPPVERLLEVAKHYGLERMLNAPAISLKENK